MGHGSGAVIALGKGLYRGRWAVFAFIIVQISILLVAAFWPEWLVRSGTLFVFLYLILSLAVPGAVWSVTNSIKIRFKPIPADQAADILRHFRQRLVAATKLDELTEALIECARAIFPLVGASFMVYDPSSGMYERINEWSIDGQALPQPRSLVGLDLMSTEVVSQSPPLGFFIPRDLLVNPREPQQLNCFYMPLHFGDAQLAVLHLFFPPRALFTSEQIGILNEVALDMTLAIERVQLRQMVSNQRATIKEEHHRIARNLHDTLGQNLAYLRLKLDQLSGADAMKDIALIRLELERMRDIADQAYNQVRGSLSELREDTIPDISRIIHECALEAGQRAGFSVNLMSSGEPRILSVPVYKQTLFIIKEALRNIEQHAEASQVWINFSWDRECLSTMIKDDGIGFDLDDSSNHYGHYGLKIIRERADEIRASLELASRMNVGTELILRVPIQAGEK